MQIAKQNKSAPAILAALAEHGEMTVAEIASKTGITPRSVERNARQMKDKGWVRVVDWIPPPGRGKQAPVYCLGGGENIPCPRPTKAQSKRRKAEWQRAKRARRAVEARMQASYQAGVSNPFRVLAAQLGAI